MTSGHGTFNQENARQAFQQDSFSPSEQPILPLLGLHQALERAGAYDKIRKEKHKQVLQAYLTTDMPMGDLRELAGVKTPQDVGTIIRRSLQKVFSYLPQEVQEEYINPKAAIKRKSAILTPISRERHKEGIANRTVSRTVNRINVGGRPKGRKDSQARAKRSDVGMPRAKRELSASHKQHISEGQFKRWQRSQEQKAQSTPSQDPQTIIDFTETN